MPNPTAPRKPDADPRFTPDPTERQPNIPATPATPAHPDGIPAADRPTHDTGPSPSSILNTPGDVGMVGGADMDDRPTDYDRERRREEINPSRAREEPPAES